MPEERELVEVSLPLQLRRIPRWCLDFNSTESSVHHISKPLSPCLLPFWLPKSSTAHPRPIQLRRLTRHESGQSLGLGMLLTFQSFSSTGGGSSLRLPRNDDLVQPRRGFGAHPHRDMDSSTDKRESHVNVVHSKPLHFHTRLVKLNLLRKTPSLRKSFLFCFLEKDLNFRWRKS